MRMQQPRLRGDGGRCGNRHTQICFEKEGGGDSIGELETELAWPCSRFGNLVPCKADKESGALKQGS